ncbi:MAG: hypothetical protein EXR92_05030 [Gemmatimonadetes bacterium]|nr:hypothetical protein [Gemmatimonadota bacterium]
MKRALLLFDDRVAREWHPFSLTRPIGELLFGASLLREKLERVSGLRASGYLATPGLEGFEEMGAPSVLSLDRLPQAAMRLVLSSRYVPTVEDGRRGSPLLSSSGDLPQGGIRLAAESGATIGWILSGTDSLPSVHTHPDSDGRPVVRLRGRLLENPWQLLSENARQLSDELGDTRSGRGDPVGDVLRKAEGVHVLGDHPITVESGVRIDPLVVLDARSGPIHLSNDVWLQPLTHLLGPAYVGPGSTLIGGVFEALSCGPVSKLNGEVRDSIVLGYSNKAHHGYLGHSMLGRWVNLGALTTNSDLKNNYGPIRVGQKDHTLDTGLMKLGVFLGDHVKTGIGTLLGAGTVVGAGTNLVGDGLSTKWIPPFSWGSGAAYQPYHLEAFLESAERAMSRRQVMLTAGQRSFLGAAWRRSHPS